MQTDEPAIDAAIKAERQRIAEWLREKAVEEGWAGDGSLTDPFIDLSNAIIRGEHRT